MERLLFKLFCTAIAAAGLLAGQTIVSPGQNLQSAIDNATAGSTILVNPGTYNLSGTLLVLKSLTIRNNVAGAANYPNIVIPLASVVGAQVRASNVTLDGLKISGTNWGIYVGDSASPQTAFSNVALRNLTVDTVPDINSPGHGIYVQNIQNATLFNNTIVKAQFNGILVAVGSTNAQILNNTVNTTVGPDSAIKLLNSDSALIYQNTVTNAGTGCTTDPNDICAHGILLETSKNTVVDSNTIVQAPSNGILADNGSDNAVIINNTVNTPVKSGVQQQGIAVKNSLNVVVSGNTIGGPYFDGVELLGARRTRVEKNKISGFTIDGITLTTDLNTKANSPGNYIGQNIVADQKAGQGITSGGVGVWLDYQSDGALVFGNTLSGAPENGLVNYNSTGTYLRANVTHDNNQGGVFIYHPVPADLGYSNAPAPSYTYIQNNYMYNLAVNSGMNFQGSSFDTAAGNFIIGPSAGTQAGGIFLQNSTSDTIYRNSLFNLPGVTLKAFSGTTGATYFLNRHYNTVSNSAEPPATIQFDGGSILGGNYWNDNQSPAPYPNIAYNPAGSIGGPYADRFPYLTENLGRPYSISVTAPVAGQVAAAGSQKTIEWQSQGCVFVNLYYISSATGKVAIASAYPDVNFYNWTLPASLPAGTDYVVGADCLTGAQTAVSGVTSSSAAFTVGKAGLILLSPGPYYKAATGASQVVAWSKIPTVGAVNVLVKSGNGSYSTVASNVTNDFTTITLPATASNQVSVMIQNAADGTMADAVDEYFTVTAGTPSVTGITGGSTFRAGDVLPIQWIGMLNADYVDINVVNPQTSAAVNVATNLPEFGRYTMLIPAVSGTGWVIQITFKDASRNVLTTVSSPTFTVTTLQSLATVVSLSPTSGSGTPQTFTATFGSTNSSASIYSLASLLVNNSLSGVKGCLVLYNRATNELFLENDFGYKAAPGTSLLGPITVGSGTLNNTQCQLDGAASTATLSGTNLVLTVKLSFTGAFQGAKNVYLNAIDTSGESTGWVQSGTWTVGGNQTPTVVSLSPASGTGQTQTFTATYSDVNGSADIHLADLLFNTAANGGGNGGANACYVRYDRLQNNVVLLNDAGNAFSAAPIAPGSSGSLSNSQCTVSGTGLAVSVTGNTLAVAFPITFTTQYSGDKLTYLNVVDNEAAVSGFSQAGTWNTGGIGPQPPVAGTVTPSSGSGLTQVFTATWTDAIGASTISLADILFNTVVSATQACYVEYNQGSNSFRLLNDAGTVFLGPIALGSGSLSNSQCTINGAGASATASGNTLSVAFPITFTSSFTGLQNIYLYGTNNTGLSTSSFTQVGTWTPSGVGPQAPTPGTVTPAAGTGLTQSFTATWTDGASGGATTITTTQILFNSAINPATACFVQYNASANSFQLMNDAGTAFSAAITLGAGSLSNSQCTVSGAGASATISGSKLTVVFPVTFSSLFSGTKNVYLWGINNTGLASSFTQVGTWTPVAPAAPAAGTVTPSSGAGSTQTFTATYTDSAGANTISTADILINTAIAAGGACFVEYNQSLNTLRLFNDAGTAWLGPITAGSGSLSNSQCTINGAGASASTSGNTLTVAFPITFGSGFTGQKNIYLYGVNNTGLASSFTQVGAWSTNSSGPQAPFAGNVSPASGAGLVQTFTATWTDPAGAGTISLANILFNKTASGTAACFLEYNQAASTFRLLNDAGTTWLGPIPLGSGTLSNSQCNINGAGASASASGNTLTVTFPVVFATAFAGQQNTYLFGTNNTGLSSAGFTQAGTWTVAGGGVPQGVSFTPAAGSGTNGVFTGVFNHTGGASQHYLAYMLFLPTPNVVNYTAQGSCLMEYNKFINGMRLVNDAGTDWLGGASGIPISQGGTLSNSVCTLNVGASSAVFNGNTLTVNYSVTFKSGFKGRLATFLQELDVTGQWAGVTQFGNWTAFTGTTPTGPNATPATPASGAGSSATFTTTFSHSSGLSNVYFATVLISANIVGSPGCQVFYFQGTNTLNLINDAGTGFVSANGVTPGGPFGALSNSRCSLTAGTVTPTSGTSATMVLNVSFSTANFAGAKNVYVDSFDNAGLVTHWVSGATWTVQ